MISQNCLECKGGYYFEFQTSNCFNYSIIEKGFYFFSNDSKFHKCDNHCKLCFEGIDINTPNCTSCDSEYYLFPLNNTCLNSCPDNYIIDDEQNKCIEKYIEPSINYSEFKNKISTYISYISLFVNSSKVINGTDFIAMIFSADNMDPKEQLKNGISAVDLGNCEKIIKDYYNMTQGESLIVLNMESKINKSEENENTYIDLGKNTKLQIYDFSGKKLDLSVCEENIKVMKYINDIVDEKDIIYAKNYYTEGIDVFNAKHNFFNDICFYYDNNAEKDIILNDRRNEMYKYAAFCQHGCHYDGIDYELMYVNCQCNSKALQNDDINNNQKEDNLTFDSEINSLFLNFNVLKCSNLAFNTKILKKNFGFYFMLVTLILQILFLFNYMSNGVENIKKYMINQSNNKNKNSLLGKKKNNNNSKFQKGKIFNKKIINGNGKLNNNGQNNMNKFPKKGNVNKSNNFKKIEDVNSGEKANFIKSDINIFNRKNININKNVKKGNIIHQAKVGKQKSINKNNSKKKLLQIKSNRIKDDFEDLSYEKAIIYDKRNCCRIYFALLIENQVTFTTFCGDNKLYLFYIKLSFLIYTFELSFFLNSLFYSDEYISKAYYNNGKLDFASGLPKSIYSAITCLIIRSFIKMLINNKYELKQIIRGKGNNNNINNKYHNHLIKIKLEKLSNKLIVYFIIIILLDLFFSYYVIAFCAVYRNSQKYIFIGFLASFGLDIIFSILICILLSFLRFISINMKIKCLYALSNI